MTKEEALNKIDDFIKQLEGMRSAIARLSVKGNEERDELYDRLTNGEIIDLVRIREALLHE